MQTSKSRLLLAAFIVLVAIVLATSATYAWLSMDTSPEVWQFDVEVTSGDNISIAVTSVNGAKPGPSAFKSYVSKEEINNFGNFYDLSNDIRAGADSLTTVTTQDTDTFTMNYPKNTFNADQAAYFAFDLHFKGDMPYNIRLNPNRSEVDSQGATSMPTYFWAGNSYSGAVDTVIPASAKDAVRIAFGGAIFEPNADQGWGNFGGDANVAIDAYNYYKGANIVAPLGPNVFNAGELNGFTHTLLTLEQTGEDLFEGKFTAKIWLEGWDADALDSIKSQLLSIMLGFEGDLNDDILALESIEGKTYDGIAYNLQEHITLADSLSGGAVSYSYKPQGNPVAFNTTAPKDAGLYTVKISRAGYNNAILNTYFEPCTIYANFEIKKKDLTVSVTSPASITYGEALPDLTYTADDLITGDTLTGELAIDWNGAKIGSAGEYNIIEKTTFANDNYNITFEKGTLTIEPKDITVTANSYTITYGDDTPDLTYLAPDLVNGDTLIGELDIDWNGNAEGDAGEYDITQGTVTNDENPNYNITFVDGTLTIEPKDITVTADSYTITYGDEIPTLTYLAPDLVNGDTLEGNLKIEWTGNEGDAGEHDIIEDESFVNSNYNIQFVKGTLTIEPKEITVTADSHTITYGEDIPDLTYSAPELVAGDTLTGELAIDWNGEIPNSKGIYNIIQGNLGNSNYNIDYIKGTLTIK